MTSPLSAQVSAFWEYLTAALFAFYHRHKTFSERIDLSCALPLDNLDMTVPIGIPRVSAISLMKGYSRKKAPIRPCMFLSTFKSASRTPRASKDLQHSPNIEQANLPFADDFKGHPSLNNLLEQQYQILTF